jgi:hypothetical protein
MMVAMHFCACRYNTSSRYQLESLHWQIRLTLSYLNDIAGLLRSACQLGTLHYMQ